MANRLILLTLFLVSIIIPTFSWEKAETLSISGEVYFPKTGDIYIKLVTEEQFKSDSQLTAGMILKIGDKELKNKRVPFKFENIKKGKYGFMAFQDVNGNGKLDMGSFGPEEPWGTYYRSRPFASGPKFEEMVFELNKNMSNIKFLVE